MPDLSNNGENSGAGYSGRSASGFQPAPLLHPALSADFARNANTAGLGQAVNAWTPFPVDALPATCRDYVLAQSAALPIDAAAVAVPMLAVLASAIGNSRRIRLKATWEMPPVLWVCLVMPPGSRKSAAVESAVHPVYELERRLDQLYKNDYRAYEAALLEWKSLPKKLRGPEPQQPRRARHRIGDITVESVAAVHAANPRGLLLFRDELAAWIGSFDRYASGKADRPNWIGFYEGRPVVIDRKSGTPPTLFIHSPCVSVCGTTQPYILESEFSASDFASGFATRIMFVEPPTTVTRWNEVEIGPEVRSGYGALFDRLRDIPFVENESSVEIALSSDARKVWGAFYDSHNGLLEELPDGPLRAVFAKIEAVCARIALILHLADVADVTDTSVRVTRSAMDRAIRIAVWLREEQRRVYTLHAFDHGQSTDPWRERIDELLPGLPDEFETNDLLVQLGDHGLNVSDRTIRRDLNRAAAAGLVKKTKKGCWRKVPLA